MNTNCEEWCRIECGHCKWFKVNADMDGVKSICKRLDHKHLRFAKKIFKSYDCGCFDINTCADFEPDEKKVPWLYNHWDKVKEQIRPYGELTCVGLNVDGNTDVMYCVLGSDFYNNTFINEDGSLKWRYKCYSVPDRKSWSKYRTVYETPDGLKLTQELFRLYDRGLLQLTFETLKKVLNKGDKHGSAFKEILKHYNIKDNDLSKITDNMAMLWLKGVKTNEY